MILSLIEERLNTAPGTPGTLLALLARSWHAPDALWAHSWRLARSWRSWDAPGTPGTLPSATLRFPGKCKFPLPREVQICASPGSANLHFPGKCKFALPREVQICTSPGSSWYYILIDKMTIVLSRSSIKLKIKIFTPVAKL